jgi:N-acetyl-anhydromuramyl-L-alanine amidase AmpD
MNCPRSSRRVRAARSGISSRSGNGHLLVFQTRERSHAEMEAIAWALHPQCIEGAFPMLSINESGHVDNPRVRVKIFPAVERTTMHAINGIIVHQTNGPTAASTFNSYRNNSANGAHFLIDKDGTIYQTASLYKRTNHVGLLKSRCIERRSCSPNELKQAISIKNLDKRSRHEYVKPWPSRFPGNADSIGIELVGQVINEEDGYEAVTSAQNRSLRWLVKEITGSLNVSMHEVYRHPEVSYKTETEGSTAKW